MPALQTLSLSNTQTSGTYALSVVVVVVLVVAWCHVDQPIVFWVFMPLNVPRSHRIPSLALPNLLSLDVSNTKVTRSCCFPPFFPPTCSFVQCIFLLVLGFSFCVRTSVFVFIFFFRFSVVLVITDRQAEPIGTAKPADS